MLRVVGPENLPPTSEKDVECLIQKKISAKLFSQHFECIFYNPSDFFPTCQKLPHRTPRWTESRITPDSVFHYIPLDTLKTDIATRKKATKTPCFGKNYPHFAFLDSRIAESRFEDHADPFSSKTQTNLRTSSRRKIEKLQFFSNPCLFSKFFLGACRMHFRQPCRKFLRKILKKPHPHSENFKTYPDLSNKRLVFVETFLVTKKLLIRLSCQKNSAKLRQFFCSKSGKNN